MSDTRCLSEFHLDEFRSEYESQVFFYQVLHMQGSVYIWVGTETGEQGCVVASVAARQGVPGVAPTSTLICGPSQDAAASCAGRLQAKVHYPILLSLNIPDDFKALEHVERNILEKLL